MYPVHSQCLNHRVEPRQHFGMHSALWRPPNQAMALSCSYDTMLGQAGNGKLGLLAAVLCCTANCCAMFLSWAAVVQ